MQRLQSPLLRERRITLYIKREDLIHPHLGGNKWRKLKYNLQQAIREQQHTLLTLGGVWSNHIHATAVAGQLFGFNTIGVIRGNEAVDNANLAFARRCGMQLHFVDRQSYRNRRQSAFIKQLHQQFGDFYYLPEGGGNALALQGCREIVTDIDAPFDIITTACGTGATLAGIASALQPDQHAIGYAVLKGADFLNGEIQQLLRQSQLSADNWRLAADYHFGGYGRIDDTLVKFMHEFEQQFNIALDAVYTAKMFFGLFQDIQRNRFRPGTRIVALHTGGLQGNAGFEDRLNAE